MRRSRRIPASEAVPEDPTDTSMSASSTSQPRQPSAVEISRHSSSTPMSRSVLRSTVGLVSDSRSCAMVGIVSQLVGCTLRVRKVASCATQQLHKEVPSMLVPTVIESTSRGERAFDIYSRLLVNRIVFLGAAIDDNVTNLIIAQLLHLESENADADVAIYINSPGGDMNGLFAIHDTMRYINPDVATICVGQAASAAAVLLAAGTPGKRYALPNARVLIHQPHGGAQGQSTDMELAVAEMVEMRRRMVDILVEATGQTPQRIMADIDRDYIVRGDQAIAYGLVDHVIDRRQLPDPRKAIAAAAGRNRSAQPRSSVD